MIPVFKIRLFAEHLLGVDGTRRARCCHVVKIIKHARVRIVALVSVFSNLQEDAIVRLPKTMTVIDTDGRAFWT